MCCQSHSACSMILLFELHVIPGCVTQHIVVPSEVYVTTSTWGVMQMKAVVWQLFSIWWWTLHLYSAVTYSSHPIVCTIRCIDIL